MGCSVIRSSQAALENDFTLLDGILGDVSRKQPLCLCLHPISVFLSAQ